MKPDERLLCLQAEKTTLPSDEEALLEKNDPRDVPFHTTFHFLYQSSFTYETRGA
jgi:hypothetical protein